MNRATKHIIAEKEYKGEEEKKANSRHHDKCPICHNVKTIWTSSPYCQSDVIVIKGKLHVDCDAHFPNLEEVYSLSTDKWVHFQAPKLRKIIGKLVLNTAVILPSLESIGGCIYLGTGATLTAPKLRSVGGIREF